jgi:hypothetical protein
MKLTEPPHGIIQHAIWPYLRFTLSLRDVGELLVERGFVVTYETVRAWVARFGPLIARPLRRRHGGWRTITPPVRPSANSLIHYERAFDRSRSPSATPTSLF